MKVSTYAMAGLLVGTMLTTTTVSAVEGDITNTGPGSNNQITYNVNDSCYVTSNNNVYLTSSNQQIGTSGQVTIDSNTNSGTATSGDVGNANEAVIVGTITNAGACAVVAVTPTPTPTPTPIPEQPGKVESAQVQAPVGGVKAGSGGADQSGVIAALLAASVLAVGAGLRKLHAQKQS